MISCFLQEPTRYETMNTDANRISMVSHCRFIKYTVKLHFFIGANTHRVSVSFDKTWSLHFFFSIPVFFLLPVCQVLSLSWLFSFLNYREPVDLSFRSLLLYWPVVYDVFVILPAKSLRN